MGTAEISLAEAAAQLEAAEEEERHLYQELARLQSQADGAHSKVARCKKQLRSIANSSPSSSWNAKSHIAVLPFELLRAIFQETIVLCLRSSRMELVISHVCQRWRHIALDTPSLWTRVRLYPTQSTEIFDLYLQRSQQLPLHILFGVFFPPTEAIVHYMNEIESLASAVISCANRWESINIFSPSELRDLFYELRNVHAPLLKELKISGPQGLEDSQFESHINPYPLFAGGTPNLVSLHVSFTPPLFSTFPTSSSLTTLVLASSPQSSHPPVVFSQFYDLVSASPMLSSMEFTGCPISFDNDALQSVPSLPFTLSNLRTLKFEASVPREIVEFVIIMLGLISAPGLEHLGLSLFLDESPQSERYYQWLRDNAQNNTPPFPSLKSLTLRDNNQFTDVAHDLICTFPTIERVTFIAECANIVLGALERSELSKDITLDDHGDEIEESSDTESNSPRITDANEHLWTNLRHVIFCKPSFDWVTLFSVLDSRVRNGLPVNTIKIVHTHPRSVEVLKPMIIQLERYRGMEIEMEVGQLVW